MIIRNRVEMYVKLDNFKDEDDDLNNKQDMNE